MLPDKFYAVKSAYALCSAPVVETYVRSVDIRAAAPTSSRKVIRPRRDLARYRGCDRVVGVEHRPISSALSLEQPRFDARVFGETAVSVEMIGRDVEKNRYVRAYPAVFQHKAGHLDDRNAETRHVRPLRRKRHPYVAQGARIDSCCTQDVLDQRHRGRLAVGPADRDLPRRTDRGGKLQLRKHRYPLFAERGKQRMRIRNGRTCDSESYIVRDAVEVESAPVVAPPGVRAVVIERALYARRTQQFRRSFAARAGADDQRASALGDACPQRLCNVLSRKSAHSSRHIAAASSATAPATAVTIVYWATILLSLTPLYSR